MDPESPKAKRRRGLMFLYGAAVILQLPIPSLLAPLNGGSAGPEATLVFWAVWLVALGLIEWLTQQSLKSKKPSALAQVALLDGGLFGMALVLSILLFKYGASGWAWGLVVSGLLWLLRGFLRLVPLV
jgi:hypothetical protein